MFNLKDVAPRQQTYLNTTFKNTALYSKAEDILKSLCFNFEEGKEWAKNCFESPWDYKLFQRKPLFIMDSGVYIAISKSYLVKQIFASLYWNIRNCYPNENTNFLRFFGRPFEIYLTELIRKASEKSGLPYEFLPQFEYGTKRFKKKSPEVILKLGNKLLAIEGKAKSMTEKSIIDGEPSAIDKDFEKLVMQPFRQLHNRLLELFNGESQYDFSDIKEIHLISVSQIGGFPTIKPFESKMSSYIETNSKLPISTYCHMDIEEFEVLCNLIGRNARKPIFRILENKQKNHPYIPFKNFLLISSLPCNRPEFLSVFAKEFLEELKRLLFP